MRLVGWIGARQPNAPRAGVGHVVPRHVPYFDCRAVRTNGSHGATVRNHDDVTAVCLTCDLIHKCGGAPIDVVERFPPIRMGIDVHDPIAPNTGDTGMQQVRGQPLRCPETPLAQPRIGLDGEPRGHGEYLRRLSGPPEVTGDDRADPTTASILGSPEMCSEPLGLATTSSRENRIVTLALHQAEHVPRALAVPHHPKRAFVLDMELHGFKNVHTA